MIEQTDLYLKTDTGIYVHLLWSDNPPYDPNTATAVIGIYSYKNDGSEYEGGELDIQKNIFDLNLYADECLNYIDINYTSYDIIDEDTFDNIIDESQY